MNLQKLLDGIIAWGFYLLFFLVPLVMTPWNYELFEYNKMMLTYGLTVVIIGAWLAKMVLQKKVLIRRTPLDLPILLFFLSQLISTVFSIDRHTSFWGYYSRFHGGFLSTTSYLLLFYALIANFNEEKIKKALRLLLSSAFLVSFYGILEHFGIDAKYWVQDVQSRVFSTLGQPNWLAAWLAILIPIPVALALPKKLAWPKNPKDLETTAYYLLFITFTLCLLFTLSRSGLAGFALSWASFWGLIFYSFRKDIKRVLRPFLITNSILFLIFVLAGTPWTPSLSDFVKKLPKKTWAAESVAIEPTPTITHEVLLGGTESLTIRKIVWKGAMDIWRAYPFFGSGVETFAYSYYQFRPAEHNLISEWDYLYNKAHNEYLNFLSTTGAIGLGTYLLLIFWIIGWNMKQFSPPAGGLNFALFSGWLSILLTNFFGFSIVPVAIPFFLFPAINIVLATKREDEERNHGKLTNLQNGSMAMIALVSLYFLYLLARFWYADTLFAKAKKWEKQGDALLSLNSAQKAANLNKKEPIYHDTLSYSAATLAEAAFIQKNKELTVSYTNLALTESNLALAISPRNLNFWKTRVKIFYKLASIDQKYLEQALMTLNEATRIAPTDAKIFYNLGLVYYQLGQTDKAIEVLEKTIVMKKNYQDARFALGLIYEQVGNKQKALEHTDYVLTYLNSSVTEIRQLYKRLTGKEFGEK